MVVAEKYVSPFSFFGILSNIRAMHKPLVAVVLIAAAIQGPLSGCECVPVPPPCVAYTYTDMIFRGTVTQFEGGIARMRIDKAYKGVTKKIVALWSDPMCGGPSFQAGEQYVIYTSDIGGDYLPVSGCSRSRNVRDAKEDLMFLDGLAKAPPTATVFGKVTVRSGAIYGEGEPATAAAVEIQGQGRKRTSSTDREGNYSFSGLAPGSYSVKASLPGFTLSESETDDPVQVIARGCGMVDLGLRKNWNTTLSGRVTRADGMPGPVWLNVDLIRIDGSKADRKPELLIGFTMQTDEHGEYSFRGLAPGLYKVVLNLHSPPTVDSPYRMIYWPAASTEAAGSTVEVTPESSVRCDFRLPPPLKSALVTVVVLLPDGTPARDVNVNIGTRLDGNATSNGSAVTDAYGKFTFGAIEGFEYTARDILTREARMASEVHFSAADGDRVITIRLVNKE